MNIHEILNFLSYIQHSFSFMFLFNFSIVYFPIYLQQSRVEIHKLIDIKIYLFIRNVIRGRTQMTDSLNDHLNHNSPVLKFLFYVAHIGGVYFCTYTPPSLVIIFQFIGIQNCCCYFLSTCVKLNFLQLFLYQFMLRQNTNDAINLLPSLHVYIFSMYSSLNIFIH